MGGLHELLREGGAVFAGHGDERTPRHFGDPRREYREAMESCGVVHRADRRLLRVHGRAPRQMLHGILTNRIPEPPVGGAGEAVYGTVLTPKGRMVTDLTTLWLGAGEGEGLGLDVATSGHAAVLGHFTRFLPPRFAQVDDLSGRAGLLTLVGPGAEGVVRDAFGTAPEAGYLLQGGGPIGGGLLVARGLEQVPSWNVWASADDAAQVWRRLETRGAAPVGWAVWETMRIEAGLPAFGVDMDETTIPVEAGLVDRAFDHDKGCYTGQEVIVRIRHRGRVNWHLRALRFGDAAPAVGQELFEAGGAKVRGRVTSVAQSPRFGQAIGLGYVRREFEPPAVLRLGSGAGPEVGVEQC
ncbi:MAG: hypothetical protein OXU69_07485 [Gemmatimonadota bacterium]|nr:hypothetical protein [Gemmatimonadota bacterium]MDE2984534.1 hypothetical protein [Gemmatimonadota bacterium]